MADVPESLRKRGLLRITSNVPPGGAVRLPKGALMTFFGNDLLARFTTTPAKTARPVLCPPKGDSR